MFDQAVFDDAKRKLDQYWSLLRAGAIEATPEFRLSWNQLADIVRQREIVPKYPIQATEHQLIPAQSVLNGRTELRFFNLSVTFLAERTGLGALVMPIDPMPYIAHTWDVRMLA